MQVGSVSPDGRTGAWASVDAFQNSSADPRAFAYMGTNTNHWQVSSFITHEVGHTLGLDHDGSTAPPATYFGGHLTPSGMRWSPNMGISWGNDVFDQWSKGEYANATTTEDDLAIITRPKNFGYRADDAGNTPAAATPLAVSASKFTQAGVIEQRADKDVYSFTLSRTADVTLNIDPAVLGANLDVLAKLYSASGLVATSNPTDSLAASFQVTLPAGKYFIEVDGTGQGDPRTNGYSDYGSIGQYTVTGTLDSGGLAVAVADGTYSLGNAKSGLALAAPAGARVGSQVIQAALSDNGGQQWEVRAAGSGYYTITNVATGLRLDNAGNSTTAGTRIVLWTAHGGDNQLWSFRSVYGGGTEIVNKRSGLVLDVSGGSRAAGAPVIQWSSHQGANQQWSFNPVLAGTFALRNANSGLVADVPGGSTTAGTGLVQWGLSGTAGAANQQWVVRQVAGGYHVITNVRSGQALTGGSTAGSAAVQKQVTGTPTDAQLWSFVPQAGGGYAIVNKASGLSLDVTGGSTSYNAKLVTTAYTGAQSQTWGPTRV